MKVSIADTVVPLNRLIATKKSIITADNPIAVPQAVHMAISTRLNSFNCSIFNCSIVAVAYQALCMVTYYW